MKNKFEKTCKGSVEKVMAAAQRLNKSPDELEKQNEEISKKLDDIRSQIENKEKVLEKELNDIEPEELNHIIKSHSALNQGNLIKLFYCIAQLKYNQGKLHSDPQKGELHSDPQKYYTDCATACMYVQSIASNAMKNPQHKNLERNQYNALSYKLLQESYNALINFCYTSRDSTPKKIAIDNEKSIIDISGKNKLDTLRKDFGIGKIKEIKAKNDEDYIKETKEYFSKVTDAMNNYLKTLFVDAQALIGNPPCDYAVIGLGSMATQQITPYSDLEFTILTANEDYKSNDEYKNYFKNLTHIVHFKNICLGETIIPDSAYNVDLSGYVKRAVNFDLGGKTPLGRIDNDKNYDLIQTVDKMLQYVVNAGEKAEHIDKALACILEKTCFVYGDRSLFKSYNEGLFGSDNEDTSISTDKEQKPFMNMPSKAIEGLTIIEYRAFKALKIGTQEQNSKNFLAPALNTKNPDNKKLQKSDSDSGSKDSSEKSPRGNKPDLDNHWESYVDKPLDVKQDIYRVSDRFIYYLGQLFEITGAENSWETLEELNKKEVLTLEGCTNLQKALSFACLLRAEVYSTYGYQKELLFFSSASHDQSSENELSEIKDELLDENSRLFEFFYTMLPLYEKLDDLCNEIGNGGRNLDSIISGEKFCTNTLLSKMKIYNRLGNEKESLECARKIEISAEAGIEAIDKAISQSLNSLNYLSNLDLLKTGEYKTEDYAKATHELGKAIDLYDQSIQKAPQKKELVISLLVAQVVSFTYTAHLNDQSRGYLEKILFFLGKNDTYEGAKVVIDRIGSLLKIGEFSKDSPIAQALPKIAALYEDSKPEIADEAVSEIVHTLKLTDEVIDIILKSLQTKNIDIDKVIEIYTSNINNKIVSEIVKKTFHDFLSQEGNEVDTKAKEVDTIVRIAKLNESFAQKILGKLQHMLLAQDADLRINAFSTVIKVIEQDFITLTLVNDLIGSIQNNLRKSDDMSYKSSAIKILGKIATSNECNPKLINKIIKIILPYLELNSFSCNATTAGAISKIAHKIPDNHLVTELLIKNHRLSQEFEYYTSSAGIAAIEKILEYNRDTVIKIIISSEDTQIRDFIETYDEHILSEAITKLLSNYEGKNLDQKSFKNIIKIAKSKIEDQELVKKLLQKLLASLSSKDVEIICSASNAVAEVAKSKIEDQELLKELLQKLLVSLSNQDVKIICSASNAIAEVAKSKIKDQELVKVLVTNLLPLLKSFDTCSSAVTALVHVCEFHGRVLTIEKLLPFLVDQNIPCRLSASYVISKIAVLNEDLSIYAIRELRSIIEQEIPSLVRPLIKDTIDKIISNSDIHLNKEITNFEALPDKSENSTRIISYNIAVDFFDGRDQTEEKIHTWQVRAKLCKELIVKVAPDIFCLQELSPDQASELSDYFGKKGYEAKFLCQTPSEIAAGEIADGEALQSWIGKNVGTALIGTFFSNKWSLVEEGVFWLNDNPYEIPTNKDRGETDKGFGNMNTYRAVFCTKLEMTDQPSKCLYVFNSHYPLSGDSQTRKKCAELEMKEIEKIAGDKPWVSAGDRNLIPVNNDRSSPDEVYKEFLKYGYDIRNSDNHFGISTSWIGFTYDQYCNKIKISADEPNDFQDDTVLDLMISSMRADASFHLHGAFGLSDDGGYLLPLTGELSENQISFVSDHALIGADFQLPQ